MMNKKILIAASILLFLSANVLFSQAILTVSRTLSSSGEITTSTLSWLHTNGKDIKTADNQTVFLRGAAFGGLGESGASTWNGGLSTLTRMFNQYVALSGGKANVIRVGTGAHAGWGTASIFDTAIDQIVALAKTKNVRIIIEFHGGLSSSDFTAMVNNPQPLVDWFTHFATRYRNEPTVTGFELYNEPNSGLTTQAAWASAMTQVANAIQAINPNALILVASIPYGSVSSYWLTHPIAGNLVYTWDVYYCNIDNYWKTDYYNGNLTAGHAKTVTFFDNYIAIPQVVASLPVFCSEIGWYGDASPAYPNARNEAGWRYQMADLLSTMNARGTNYYVFWWWGNPGQQGLASNFNYDALSPQGQVWANCINAT
jgi:hypothetical protein